MWRVWYARGNRGWYACPIAEYRGPRHAEFCATIYQDIVIRCRSRTAHDDSGGYLIVECGGWEYVDGVLTFG